MNNKLPKFLNQYFWDVDDLEIKSHSLFIIERLLEYGDKKAVLWMMNNFEKSQIRESLRKRKSISAKSANYWASIFGVPRNKILCLNKSYQKRQKTHWLS